MGVQSPADRTAINIFCELRVALKECQKPNEHFWETCDRIIRAGIALEHLKSKAKTKEQKRQVA